MSTALTILFVTALVGTLVVLALGVVQMARGSPDGARSNKLMQYRVLFQAAAVVIFVAILLLLRG
ncbi:MAG: twin transmembrane helix small protein [Alphaproteobacteria bacterium]|nr:twin transmembrane helix small protein [Alphaproteobacteria bacterium]